MKNNILKTKSFILFIFFITLFFSCKPTQKIPTNANFKGTNWELRLMHGNQLSQNTLTQKININFDLKDSTKFNSFLGCNNGSGKYLKSKNNLTFGQIEATKMACDIMKVEDEFVEVLQKTDRYVIKGHTMYFYDKKDYILAVFDAQYMVKNIAKPKK